MKSRKDRFDGEKELGKRLRECRLKAGLTQQKLATAMGRQGKGSHHVAGRLERGEVPNPGVGLIADYLRACRASFADIQDVLDRYTAKPSVVEVETSKLVAKVCDELPPEVNKAAQRYDRRVVKQAESKHEPVPEPAERVRRARNFGLSQVWARRVRREVVRIIETKHLAPGTLCEHYLQDYGASVWRILNHTRGKRAGKRTALLEEAARPFLGEGGPEPEHLDAVREGLLEFFQHAEAAGELDTQPPGPLTAGGSALY